MQRVRERAFARLRYTHFFPRSAGDAEGDLACRELNTPFYGALEYNGSQVPANQQPSWRENDTVVFVCTRGYLLWGSSDQPLGTRWSITCEAPSTSGSGSGGSGGSGYGTWSENPQQFRCSRES